MREDSIGIMFHEFSGFHEDQPVYNIFIAGDPERPASSFGAENCTLQDRLLTVLKEREGITPLENFHGAITYEDYWFSMPHPLDVGLTWKGRNFRLGNLATQDNILAFLACHHVVAQEAYPHLLLLAVDAAHGLTPWTREQIEYIAVSGYDDVLIFLEGAHQVEQEVLALVEEEITEELARNELKASILFDRGEQDGAMALWNAITAIASAQKPAAPAPTNQSLCLTLDHGITRDGQKAACQFHKLAGILYVSRSRAKQHIGDNTVIKVSDGLNVAFARVALKNKDVLGKGEVGRAVLALNSPLPARRGQRLTVELIDFPPRRDSICFFRIESTWNDREEA